MTWLDALPADAGLPAARGARRIQAVRSAAGARHTAASSPTDSERRDADRCRPAGLRNCARDSPNVGPNAHRKSYENARYKDVRVQRG